MRHKQLTAILGLMVAVSPVAAAQPEPSPEDAAPAASANAKYCLRVEPVTGSRIEMVRCETREEWALLGVDVDKDWAEEGVRVIG